MHSLCMKTFDVHAEVPPPTPSRFLSLSLSSSLSLSLGSGLQGCDREGDPCYLYQGSARRSTRGSVVRNFTHNVTNVEPHKVLKLRQVDFR